MIGGQYEFGRIPGFAGNRAFRGSAIAPAPALRAAAASHPSNPLRGVVKQKKDSCAAIRRHGIVPYGYISSEVASADKKAWRYFMQLKNIIMVFNQYDRDY
jgi:ribosomal protein L36